MKRESTSWKDTGRSLIALAFLVMIPATSDAVYFGMKVLLWWIIPGLLFLGIRMWIIGIAIRNEEEYHDGT